LAEDRWERLYELTFSLEYHRAACELLTADLAVAERAAHDAFKSREKLVDIAAVACVCA